MGMMFLYKYIDKLLFFLIKICIKTQKTVDKHFGLRYHKREETAVCPR